VQLEGAVQLRLREEPLLKEHLPQLLRRVLSGHHGQLVSGRLSVLVTVAGLLKGLEPAGRAREASHLEDTSAKLEAVSHQR
jgi:hypothetical protein